MSKSALFRLTVLITKSTVTVQYSTRCAKVAQCLLNQTVTALFVVNKALIAHVL